MITIVVDTSVLVRYLIRPSAATRELVEIRWLGDEVRIVTAPELIAELEDVLGRSHIQNFVRPEESQILLEAIRQKADMVPHLGNVPSYTRDPKDDKFIACALAGGAKFVISVDKDILDLGALGNIRMMTPYDFIALLRETT